MKVFGERRAITNCLLFESIVRFGLSNNNNLLISKSDRLIQRDNQVALSADIDGRVTRKSWVCDGVNRRKKIFVLVIFFLVMFFFQSFFSIIFLRFFCLSCLIFLSLFSFSFILSFLLYLNFYFLSFFLFQGVSS